MLNHEVVSARLIPDEVNVKLPAFSVCQKPDDDAIHAHAVTGLCGCIIMGTKTCSTLTCLEESSVFAGFLLDV